jgi:hypothetical protein
LFRNTSKRSSFHTTSKLDWGLTASSILELLKIWLCNFQNLRCSHFCLKINCLSEQYSCWIHWLWSWFHSLFYKVIRQNWGNSKLKKAFINNSLKLRSILRHAFHLLVFGLNCLICSSHQWFLKAKKEDMFIKWNSLNSWIFFLDLLLSSNILDA